MGMNSTDFNLVEGGNSTTLADGILNVSQTTMLNSEDTRYFAYPGEFRRVPLWEIIIKLVFSSVVICLALVGNLTVLFIVFKNKRMRTTTNFYIANLAVSDLMVTFSCTWVRHVPITQVCYFADAHSL